MAPPRRPAKGAIHQGNPNVTLSFVTNNGTSTARSQARAPDLAAQDDRDILELLYLLDPSYASERPHPQTIPPSWPLPTPAQPRPLYDKKALLVGTNYSTHPDSQFRLKWGVRDAHEIAHFLHKSFGFEGNNMRVLTDDQPGNLPTKTNILTAMRWLVEGARTGDSLFFYFSGHAAQIMIMDTYEDEDELGECICAMDYKGNGQFRPGPTTPGVILDDDIHDIMVKTLPRGCRLTAVLDCCHSGTLLALPFIFDSQGVLKHSPNVVQQESTPGDVVSDCLIGRNTNSYDIVSDLVGLPQGQWKDPRGTRGWRLAESGRHLASSSPTRFEHSGRFHRLSLSTWLSQETVQPTSASSRVFGMYASLCRPLVTKSNIPSAYMDANGFGQRPQVGQFQEVIPLSLISTYAHSSQALVGSIPTDSLSSRRVGSLKSSWYHLSPPLVTDA
ncbi:caspase domain-containing protein [Lactarius hatsudake]|nr:caspase domain-containing protein [Lactarius hatsudake]